MNIIARFKNPYFWISVVALFLTALGVDPSALTSWDSVGQLFLDLAKNPFLIGTALVALVGVFFDPSTGGLRDGADFIVIGEDEGDGLDD